jgi:PAS domain S-box-containing protein
VPWDGVNAMMLTIRDEGGASSSVVRAFPATEGGNGAMQALRREAAELSSILDTATDGVVILDADGNIRSMSQSAEVLFGFDPSEITGKPFSLLLATESQRSASDYISGMSGGGLASVMNDGREVIGREAHGRFIPLFMTIGRLQDSDGFCAVLRDMTQWKRAEEELIEARRQAEEASATKSEFLTRVSHEIRTPLNAIIGFSELMSEERFGPIGNQRYLDYSKDIHRSGRHVLDLVNDLLDISKIEAGEQEMNFEAVALNEALAESVALMQPQANRERVIIRSSFASTLPDVVADLRSIKQIALNLLSNAVRYTGAGGQVIVSTAYELNGEVVIRVRDTGAGMRQQDIDQAMKPFKQLSTVRRGRGDGTGLGLPLTKAMVEGNRAKFEISSTPGQGTLVEIKFPPMRVLAR